MKKVNLLVAFILIFYSSFAGSIQAIQNNGNWTSNSSWDLNRNPGNNDTIIIPFGITITINTNLNFPANTMRILVYGTLNFNGGGAKLSISSSSSVIVEAGGILTNTGSPSQALNIGAQVVFTGTDAPVVGPEYANNTTGNGFVPFIILPVKFLSFTLANNSNSVLVQWSTSEEINALRYEVERSVDGINWITAGIVSASGNSNTTRNYSYTDYYKILNKTYYRIKEIDMSGSFSFTAIKQIQNNSTAENIKIYSSAQGVAVIEFPAVINEQITVRVISFSGQIITEKIMSRPFGQYMINVSKNGTFIIQVFNNTNLNITKKLFL